MNKGRKISGGKYHANRKKRLHEKTNQENKSSIGEPKTKKVDARGKTKRTIILKTNIANVTKDGKTKKVKIKNVLETPQNKFLARQNRLMKGAIVDTEIGKAKITNRPTREGCVNASIIKE